MERRAHLVAEHVDGLPDEGPAAVAAVGAAPREPGQVLAGCEPRRTPERRVQGGELLDDITRAARDVGVVRGGEPAPGCREVFEHHHVAATVGAGEPRARHPHRDLAREVAVEAGLGDTHAGLFHKGALLLVERGELHEHG